MTLAGAAYLTLALIAVLRFGARVIPAGYAWNPRISVLKPLYGAEYNLRENLLSFCEQDYHDYEVILCMKDGNDGAYAVAESLRETYPNLVRVAIGENAAMSNPKIANLAKPSAEPSGELVLISDSDMRVGRDYLRAIVNSFSSERTGAVTSLYAAMPNATFASDLGAMHVEDEFAPSVLVALMLGPLKFCMGATMAVRRAALDAIGGLAALGSHLADDHALGELVTKAGYEIELSRFVPRTEIPENTIRDLWPHELRWARTNLAMAPAGYAFSVVMYAFPFAVLYAALARTWFAAALLALVAALRLWLHYASRRALGTRSPDRAWLFPLRDVMSIAIWGQSLLGRTVRWRGGSYTAK